MERVYSLYLKMFTIERKNFDGIEKVMLINKLSGEYLSIIPSYGGNVNELVLRKGDRLHELIAGDKTIEELSGIDGNAFRGAKLSPFPNRVNKASYFFKGKQYPLSPNNFPHALHGLLWNVPFEFKGQELKNEFASITLVKQYKNEQAGFPFHYSIEIEYTLQPNSFSARTTIVNTSLESILMGDGWHPYFSTGLSIDTLKLHLPSSKRLVLDDFLIPTGTYSKDDRFLVPMNLDGIVLDHCFEVEAIDGVVETQLIDETKNITVTIFQKTGKQGYNFIQVYTPPNRKSIAIEPMSCAPDAFNNEKGLTILAPGESVGYEFGVRLG